MGVPSNQSQRTVLGDFEGNNRGTSSVLIQELQEDKKTHKMAYGKTFSAIDKVYTRKRLKRSTNDKKERKPGCRAPSSLLAQQSPRRRIVRAKPNCLSSLHRVRFLQPGHQQLWRGLEGVP
jgi:hypothetical protein